MNCLSFSLAGIQLSCMLTASAQEIVRHDSRFDRLIPSNAVVEKLADGYGWAEGPVWNRKEGFLLFSDSPNNSIFEWQEGKGVSLFLKPSGYAGSAPFKGGSPGSNGLAYDAQGRLVICDEGNHRVARLNADGTNTTLADRYMGKRLNRPNDLALKSNGDLYFTDPHFYDLSRELDFAGVYRLMPSNKLTLLTQELEAPNGIAFSPDEKTLYIANYDSNRAVWMAFEVSADGTISKGRVFFDATAWTKSKPGLPDGMKLDKEGNLFASGPGGLHVFAPDGTHLGGIEFDVDIITNCAWGGDDGSVLYITANTAIYRVKTITCGAGW
jgi:gluconolactonase